MDEADAPFSDSRSAGHLAPGLKGIWPEDILNLLVGRIEWAFFAAPEQSV